MNMGIIALYFGGVFRSVYSCWLLPHSYEGKPINSYSKCHLVVVYVSRNTIWLLCIFPESWSWAYSHGLGIKVSHKSVLGWPLCQYV